MNTRSEPCKKRKDQYCCNGSNEDDIVITGIAGRFPNADNVDEFAEGLYNKKNFISQANDRWPERVLTNLIGVIKDLRKFDASFFGIYTNVANTFPADQRILLEVTYEAIADSGYDLEELKGRKIGVYHGNSYDDTSVLMNSKMTTDDESYLLGSYNGYSSLKCMAANRISYMYDFYGPSCVYDTACSSSGFALCEAFKDIKNGICDAALVTGSQIILCPVISNTYVKYKLMSQSGKCSPFDENADGFIRGEAVTSIFLQRAKEARRIYANIVNVKETQSGRHSEAIFVPSEEAEKNLFRAIYEESGISPLEVTFLEAHGTGTKVGDPVELRSVREIFCEGRKELLPIGSVKSNIGHTEAASGLCSVIKSLITMETGVIPPNVNFKTPSAKCQIPMNGKMEVVTEPTPWKRGYIGVNNFGIGGELVHIILNRSSLDYDSNETDDNHLPQLFLFPGRTEEGVKVLFDYVENNLVRREFAALIHRLAFAPLSSKPYRGFAVMDKTENLVSGIQQVPSKKREVWYVLTGMGCQWPGMALDLMQLDVFAESMRRSAQVLQPLGIDLFNILQREGNFLIQDRRITPAFVSIAAIQIALVDVLNKIGIQPDGIVGHSTGELVCAYADGCCTAEQTILSAYWRGKAVESTALPSGSMAAVGISWDEAMKRCPEGVYPACHNAEDSVTISGLKEPIEKFVAELKAENIFARKVNAYGYGFHCICIKPTVSTLENALVKLIPDPKTRSPRWISSSYLEEHWNTPEAKMADAAYFVHNLISPVHFHEALRFIPKDAIIIEIGPHHLLQSILKRVIGNNAEYIGIMKKETNNIKHLLASIGRMYAIGLNPDVEALYPPVNFPVPRSTPSISSLIRWDHSQTWHIPKYSVEVKYTVIVNIGLSHFESSNLYLLDHCIDGRALFPATGYLMLAVKALTEIKQKEITETPVVIKNFKIRRATILNNSEGVRFEVTIFNVGGEFQINEGTATVATGRIYIPDKPLFNDPPPDYMKHESTETLSGTDIYNELRIQGYEYGPNFQGVIEADFEGNQGLVKWNGNWIPYLDSLLLFMGLIGEKSGLILPIGIESVKIDPIVHYKYLKDRSDNDLKGIPVNVNKSTMKCISGGVEIRNLKTEIAPRRQTQQNAPTLEKYQFIPYNEECALTDQRKEMCQEYLQVCCEVAKNIFLTTGEKEVSNDFRGSKNIIVDDYFNSLKEEHVLLSTLKDVSEYETSEELLKHLPEIFNNYVQNVANDILSKTLMTEVPLRTMLEIAAENSSQKLKVLEICDGRIPLSVTVQDMFIKYCHLQVNCIVIHRDPNSLNLKVLEKSDIKVVPSKHPKIDSPNERSNDIVLGTFCFGSKNDLKSYIKTLSSAVKDERFILLFHRFTITAPEAFLSEICGEVLEVQQTAELEKTLVEENLVIISKKCDTLSSSVYLLKKTVPCEARNIYKIVPVVEGRYQEWVEKLKQTLHEAQSSDIKSVWLVAQDSPFNGILGLVNCLRKEPGGEKIRCLFMDPTDPFPRFDTADSFYSEILKKDILINVYRNGTWGSYRHITMDYDNAKVITMHSYVNCMKFGDLSSFKWIDSPLKNWTQQQSEQKSLCYVYFSALNFKDVMLASGRIADSIRKDSCGNSDCIFGLEFSGRDMNGRRVMGVVNGKGMATSVVTDPAFTWEVPDEWSLEEASTVPVVYATCYYALFMRGNLQKGESILIHSGSGGIGQAAITIAISMECEIFTTVGTEEKRKFLKEKFPQLKDQNIGCSRDTSFKDLVLEQTEGKGVDIVLNSLADDKLQASVRCVANNGRFLEIGKYDLFMDQTLGLNVFLKNISFCGVFLDTFFETKALSVKNKIYGYVSEGIRNGVVKPLNTTIFNKNEIEEAFRYMASGKHIGKVVIKIRDEEPQKVIIPKSLSLPAVPRTYFSSEKCYIVIGGLGGFGIELIKWMLDRGAHNIVITSRSGLTSSYHKFCLQRCKREGKVVVVSTLNVANKEDAKKLLMDSSHIAPIGGIFNLALVLKDAIMENQTAKNFEEVCAPKAEATKNLDQLSRSLCPDIDWFVCFSSVSCGKGNPGQSNYGYANSVMERICEKRRQSGLHGLAIQWGIVGDVGFVHRTKGANFSIEGFSAQRIQSCLSTLDTFLQGDHPVVCSYVTAVASVNKEDKEIMLANLAKMLGFKSFKDIDVNRTLAELGMDSITAVEIKNILEANSDVTLATENVHTLKVGDLMNIVEGRIKQNPEVEAQANTSEKVMISLPKEIVAKDALISLNTQSSGIALFIVPLAEVIAPGLKVLAQNLNCPVYGIQCTRDIPTTGLKDMALWHLKMIQKFYPDGPINVAGYSYGAIVAFEMALQSQDSDSFPALEKLILLNCSPLINVLSGSDQYEFTKERDHVLSFVEQYAESDVSTLRDYLTSSPCLGTKVEAVKNYFMEINNEALKREDLSAEIENFCRRLEMAEKYKPIQKLRKELFMLEISNNSDLNFPSMAKTAFSEASEGLISIQEVKGTIQSLARKENANETASIINKYLSA